MSERWGRVLMPRSVNSPTDPTYTLFICRESEEPTYHTHLWQNFSCPVPYQKIARPWDTRSKKWLNNDKESIPPCGLRKLIKPAWRTWKRNSSFIVWGWSKINETERRWMSQYHLPYFVDSCHCMDKIRTRVSYMAMNGSELRPNVRGNVPKESNHRQWYWLRLHGVHPWCQFQCYLAFRSFDI